MSITVFVTDDHGIVRQGLRLLLDAHLDIVCIGEAANGHDAACKILSLQPDVAVIDIGMIGLNGIETTRQIRAACPGTQVVILSMYQTREYIFHALKAGALGYVVKESIGDELLQAILAAHQGHRFLSEVISNELIEDYLTQRGDAEMKDPLEQLSTRECEIMQFVAEGDSSIEIGRKLALSPKTVESYRSRLTQKLGLHGLPSLVKFALQHGVIVLEDIS